MKEYLKIIVGNWSSAPYLASSKWIFAPLFHLMAGNNTVITVVDFLNIWGMIFIGAGLMLGFLTRWASLGGAMMLLFYYVAYPPFPGYMIGVPAEGSYLWINRNLIEFFVLTHSYFYLRDICLVSTDSMQNGRKRRQENQCRVIRLPMKRLLTGVKL